jgi:CheY-like chemotaxis protein
LPGRGTASILALTANAYGSNRDCRSADGMNDFIAKPGQPVALFETRLKWLTRQR